MITKTFKQLKEIDALVGNLYQRNGDLANTKFGYAYKRFCEKYIVPIFKDFNSAIEIIRIDHALEDQHTKAIMRDPQSSRGYMYSREQMKNVVKAEKSLEKEWEAKEFEVEPYISPFTPEDLTDEEKEVLTGVII